MITTRAPRCTALPSGERGAITLWLLGLCIALLFLGGISLDLWRGFTERRALAAAADAAAIAGAQAIDEARWRALGELALDPELARRSAAAYLAGRDLPGLTGASVDSDARRVVVRLEGAVDLTLLAVLAPGMGPLVVRVEAVAVPLVPVGAAVPRAPVAGTGAAGSWGSTRSSPTSHPRPRSATATTRA